MAAKKTFSIEKQKLWEDNKNKINYMKESVDPTLLLDYLGFKVVKDSFKELRSVCIVHHGDNPSSFRFNMKTNTWVCFTHQCHEKYGNDIVGLIRAVKHVDFSEATTILANICGDVNFNETSYSLVETRKFLRQLKPAVNDRPKYLTEQFIGRQLKKRSSLFRVGISDNTLDLFEVGGGFIDHEGIERDIIPIRDSNGNLSGCSLRSLVAEGSKYIITPGLDKDHIIYNLYNTIPLLNKLPLILVEGFKSVWKLHELGIYNCGCIMGSSVTDGQKNLIFKYAKKGVVLLLDNDKAGRLGITKAIESFGHMVDIYPVYITETDSEGKGLDPFDLPVERLYDYLRGYF